MNSEGTVDLPGNDFDSNDFDAVDLWGADGAEGWTADPIIGVGSAATPDTGPDLDNAHGQAETDTEQEIALFTVTNPPRTVSVSTLMDGRIDHVELSARVAWLRCSRRATATIVQHQTTRAIHGELNRPGRCGDSGAPRVSRLGSQFAAQH